MKRKKIWVSDKDFRALEYETVKNTCALIRLSEIFGTKFIDVRKNTSDIYDIGHTDTLKALGICRKWREKHRNLQKDSIGFTLRQ